MKGYADLLREAQARQDAERRAEVAEAKLDQIAHLCDYPNTTHNHLVTVEAVRKILESDS